MIEAISSKVTFIILLCPIVLLSIAIFILFYYHYREMINVVLSTITGVSVIVLVWERIYELSSKKLEYVYEHVLCGIHKKAYEESKSMRKNFVFPIWLKDLKMLTDKLRRTGKTLGLVSLYPKNLVKTLENIFSTENNYVAELDRLREFSQDTGKKWNTTILWYLVYSKKDELEKSSYSRESIIENEIFVNSIMTKSPQTISNLRKNWENLTNQLNNVVSMLESFFEKNALTIPEYEKHYVVL